MPADRGDCAFQVEFLKNLQYLLTSGGFVATYKFALLHAIADLCVERDAAPDGTLVLTVDQLAVKFIELYWRQVQHFPLQGAAKDHVLKQNFGKQAAVVTTLRELHPDYRHRLPLLKNDARAWNAALRRIGRTIKVMPLWKLQTIGQRSIEFLYKNDPGADRITLLPGVAAGFRSFHGLVVELVRGAWVRYIRRHNEGIRRSLELHGFLFGSERANLDAYRNALLGTDGSRCFYCEKKIARESHVDHFIPWARYPNDLGHNLVLAHPGCNSRKSDHLAAEEHLCHWVERNEQHGEELSEAFRHASLAHDDAASTRIARWAYGELEQVRGEVWVSAKETRRLSGRWRACFR